MDWFPREWLISVLKLSTKITPNIKLKTIEFLVLCIGLYYDRQNLISIQWPEFYLLTIQCVPNCY